MGRYYVLKLNCARSNTFHDGDYNYEMIGYLSFYPNDVSSKKKPNRSYDDNYTKPGYIIAEDMGDHFEELITGTKIYYRTDSVQDIEKASYEELLEEYEKPRQISCFSYEEVTLEDVKKYIKGIRKDFKIYSKLLIELENVRYKQIVYEEMTKKEAFKNSNYCK